MNIGTTVWLKHNGRGPYVLIQKDTGGWLLRTPSGETPGGLAPTGKTFHWGLPEAFLTEKQDEILPSHISKFGELYYRLLLAIGLILFSIAIILVAGSHFIFLLK